MKRLKLILFLLLLMALPARGAVNTFTRTIDNKNTYKNSYRWTGRSRDFILEWAQEVEDRLDGSTGNQSFYFTPTDTAPTATEGRVYYNDAADSLYMRTASAWVQLEAGGAGVSLDGSYDLGVAITVDGGAVALTATDAADNVVLAIDQGDTAGSVNAVTLVSAGDAAILDFDQNGSGGDIAGSDDSWTISKTGAFVINGSITLSTADVLFDATSAAVDIQYDHSANMMHYLDAGGTGAVLGFGGAANGAADISLAYDGAGNDLNILFDDLEIAFGADGVGGDIFIYSETASSYFKFAEATDDLLCVAVQIGLDDNSDLVIGGDTEWVIDNATETLRITPSDTTDDFAIDLGSANYTSDLKIFGKTASTVEFDASADLVTFNAYDAKFGDGDILNFGDAPDITIAFDGGNGDLDILGTGLEIAFGVSDDGIDIIFHGETAGDYMMWDEGIDCLLFEDSHIKLDDAAVIYIGTKTNNQTLDGDFKIESASDTSLVITAVVANSEITIGDGTIATDFRLDNITTAGADVWFDQSADTAAGTLYLGEDGKGIDLHLYGDAASSYILWDQTADSLLTVDSDVILDDESLLIDIIDTTGTKVELGTPFYVIFKPDAEADLAYVVPAAYDLIVIDAWGYKTAGAGANAADEWLLTNDEGGAAAIFAQVELVGVGDGDRVAFTDMDDGEAEIEGGQTMTLNADENAANGCDGIIVISCVLKIAD